MSLHGTWLLALVLMVACRASDPPSEEAPTVPPLVFEPVRAVVHCLNSAGFELKLGGQPVHLSIRYPNEQVFMLDRASSGGEVREQFDRVYTSGGIDLEDCAPVVGFKERFEQAFPGHPVKIAGEIRRGTLHVLTEDKYMFFVTAERLDNKSLVQALVGILATWQAAG